MRSFRILLLVLVLIALPLASVARGQGSAPPVPQAANVEPAVTWGAEATFVPVYVWRGFLLVDSPCAQPAAWITIGDFSVTSWVNLIARRTGGGWSEHDLVVDYAHEFGNWQLSAGYTQYYFPKERDSRVSHEFSVGVAHSGLLNPTLTVYHDVKVGDGTYISAGVSQEFSLGATNWSITPAATLGYNNHQWVNGSGWSDVNLGLTVSLPPGQHVDVSGSFNYSKSLRAEWFPSRAYVGLTVYVH